MASMDLLLGREPCIQKTYSLPLTINSGRESSDDGSNSPPYDTVNCLDSPTDDDRNNSAGLRGELKRPDLKGSFRCSICQKVFCHSSSLSRHRMQAHFKNYKCTLCRKDITSNETLRTHMYKTHHISRMFMCKCCNWAFPDKTSLHMHIHAKEEGKNVTVPVIGKGLTASERLLDPATFSIPQPTVISPTLPATTILPSTLPLSYFNPANLVASQAPTTNIPSPDDLARLRDRLVLNSLLAQQGLGMAAWLNNLPKPIPTTQPPTDVVQLLKQSNEEEEEEIINVVEKDVDSKIDEDEKIISDSKSVDFKPMSVEEKRTSDSPSENASLASVDGCSPAHTSSAHSPLGVFKKDLSSTPSAFHHLNVDSRPCLEGVGSSPSHVSPSETHSSVSPDGNCYDCQVYKTKLTISDNKCRYLESRGNTLQTEAASAQSQMTIAESALRQAELETVGMKQQNELLHRRLLDCQNQCVRFLQEAERISNPQAVMLFLNQLIQTTIIQ